METENARKLFTWDKIVECKLIQKKTLTLRKRRDKLCKVAIPFSKFVMGLDGLLPLIIDISPIHNPC